MRSSDHSTQIRLVTHDPEPHLVTSELCAVILFNEGCWPASLSLILSAAVVHSERCEIWTCSFDSGMGSHCVKLSWTRRGRSSI